MTTSHSTPRPDYFCLRRPSPFQGTVQVVAVGSARAMSSDGESWQLQLQAEVPASRPWLGEETPTVSRWLGYGHWRRGRGLVRTPAHPALAVRLAQCETLLAALFAALADMPGLPFPVGDSLELWLLDAARKLPLALLSTARAGGAAPPSGADTRWYPAALSDNSFYSPSLAREREREARHGTPLPHRDVLAAMVRREAGGLGSAQWFARSAQGGGTGSTGIRLDPALEGRVLPARGFPELPLRERWETPADRRLVRDFHDWQSPLLLTLAGLKRETRGRLERAACGHALALYRVRHVLPEIIDQERVNAALVEAVLRRSRLAAPGAP